ncbi:hypothetical protein TYRP_009231 [Tyrophagus putrescentiae]|nr:hypothetical protein TYRP_009231 [Tyrophagus putrescentiae]
MINNHKYEYELRTYSRVLKPNLTTSRSISSTYRRASTCFPVDIGAIARVEVDDVGAGRSARCTIRFGHLHRSKLKHGVLLRAGGMVDGHVGHAAVPAKEIGRLPVQGDKLQRRVPFEGIEAPPLPGLLRLRRLVVLDEDAVEGVGVLGEGARQLKVGADFRRWPFGLFLGPFSRVLWI